MNSDLPKRTYEDFAKYLGTKAIKFKICPLYYNIVTIEVTENAIKFIENLNKYG